MQEWCSSFCCSSSNTYFLKSEHRSDQYSSTLISLRITHASGSKEIKLYISSKVKDYGKFSSCKIWIGLRPRLTSYSGPLLRKFYSNSAISSWTFQLYKLLLTFWRLHNLFLYQDCQFLFLFSDELMKIQTFFCTLKVPTINFSSFIYLMVLSSPLQLQ